MSTRHERRSLFRQLREGDPTTKQNAHEFYNTTHAEKKLCLVWDTGKKILLYYSYLISVDLNLDDAVNIITIQFMAHKVTLKGYNLDLLFNHFLNDEPHIISIVNERYIETWNDDFIVIDATVEK